MFILPQVWAQIGSDAYYIPIDVEDLWFGR